MSTAFRHESRRGASAPPGSRMGFGVLLSSLLWSFDLLDKLSLACVLRTSCTRCHKPMFAHVPWLEMRSPLRCLPEKQSFLERAQQGFYRAPELILSAREQSRTRREVL